MSYAWRSILKCIELLSKGVVWRIGDGSQVNIWSDPWLPRDWTRGQSLVQRVSDLIDPNTGMWDGTLIRELFWPEDVKLILSTTSRRYGSYMALAL